jgi:hypothetical protein
VRQRRSAISRLRTPVDQPLGADLSLLLERGLRTKTTVALSPAEARELADLLATGAFGSNLALLQEALLLALEASPP